MLWLTGLFALFAAAGLPQRGGVNEFWLPITFGAVAITAGAGIANVLPAVMSANS